MFPNRITRGSSSRPKSKIQHRNHRDGSVPSKVPDELYNTASIIHKTPSRRAYDLNIQPHRKILPKLDNKTLLGEQKSLIQPPKTATAGQRLNTSKRERIPITKAEGEMLMFHEIFVQPKQDKLNELKVKLRHQQFEDLVFDQSVRDKFIAKNDSLPTIMPSSRAAQQVTDTSFYNHQIQVQPPEGLNATVAAPLTPGGGWAPSIPAASDKIYDASMKDMAMRAKAGIQAGDVQKEAHMSYCLGVMNEHRENFRTSARFYKRFFFCARLLDDPVGAALALNRLGVVYHNMGKYDKSYQFHKKHSEFSDIENLFAAFYNLGITERLREHFHESIDWFEQSLQWANSRLDLESECIARGQIGMTSILVNETERAITELKVISNQRSLDFAKRMKNPRIMLDNLLSLGYLYKELGKVKMARDCFSQAIEPAQNLGETKIVEQCSCNVGIADADIKFEEFQNQLLQSTFPSMQN